MKHRKVLAPAARPNVAPLAANDLVKAQGGLPPAGSHLIAHELAHVIQQH